MAKQYKPTSPARRHGQVADFSDLKAGKPVKGLVKRLKKTGGRNSGGRITARHRGGGSRCLYRMVDFKRDKDDVPARVAAIEYDPGRSARIALLHYHDGEKRYILAPVGLRPGMEVISGEKVEPKPGNAMPLASIPLGLIIHNVELQPGRGAQLGRSAGAAIRLSSREGKYAHLIVPSGEIRKVNVKCRATIGQVGNTDHMNISLGKAGRNRLKGRRPHVRGSAMSPYCHPLGGGEGRTGAGRPPCSPTGKLSKGGKTRNPRKTSDKYIIRRRKKK
ncbi:MAG: 50S ribosomal protein L2 [Planctomycetota bacterium]|nr:MAG: 50S ribosomal protein L2 [Planctomycetota bacterium]